MKWCVGLYEKVGQVKLCALSLWFFVFRGVYVLSKLCCVA